MLRMSIRLSCFMLSLLVAASAASAQTNVTAKAGNAPAVAAPVETDRSRDKMQAIEREHHLLRPTE